MFILYLVSMIKSFYFKEIERIISVILDAQQKNGSFFEDVDSEIINARYQEAVLTLAWYQEKTGKDFTKDIERGIEFWLTLQNANGSFPEQDSESFSATAFSSAAVAKTFEYCKVGDELSANVFDCFVKVVDYFSSNFQVKRTNQQIAAYFALKEMSKYVDVDDSIFDKIENIIKSNMTVSGFFLEDDGVDLGYASLCCEMLYLCGKEEYCDDFVSNLKYFVLPDGTFAADFSRTKGWILMDFLEMFSRRYPEIKVIRDGLIDAHQRGICNVFHFPDKRHVMTDGYRLCFAYDYTNNKCADVDCVLPYEDDRWDKLFPEDILVVRRPKYMAIFYLKSKVGSVFWFNSGVVVNLSSGSDGVSLVSDGANYSCLRTRRMSYSYMDGCLKIVAWAEPFFPRKPRIVKQLSRNFSFVSKLKSLVSPFFCGGKFVKTWRFHDAFVEIDVVSARGIERVPMMGVIGLSGSFVKGDADVCESSLFYRRKNYSVCEKSYLRKLSYKLGEGD